MIHCIHVTVHVFCCVCAEGYFQPRGIMQHNTSSWSQGLWKGRLRRPGALVCHAAWVPPACAWEASGGPLTAAGLSGGSLIHISFCGNHFRPPGDPLFFLQGHSPLIKKYQALLSKGSAHQAGGLGGASSIVSAAGRLADACQRCSGNSRNGSSCFHF